MTLPHNAKYTPAPAQEMRALGVVFKAAQRQGAL